MSDVKAIIFDIDGTLSEKNSWAVAAQAMGGTHAEDLEIYFANKNGIITQEEADAKILEMWKRQGLATKANFIKAFESIPLRHDAVDLVQYLKSKGLKICVMTGSMDLYAKIIAKKVGADDCYFNAKLFFNEEEHIENFSYIADQGALKLVQLKEFCAKHNLQPQECAVIGDSENDYEIFKLTKNGIAIRSFEEDKFIETLAWKVVNNLSEIKAII